MTARGIISGGGFLLRRSGTDEAFTPEDFTSEQLMYAKTARDFIDRDVLPLNDRIEAKELSLTVALLKKAGELGLLMGDVPAEYGGLALDKASCALITENIAGQGSFLVSHLVQTGIGSLPLLYYGPAALKEKYLPGLADGTVIGCYGLTEPSAGSDALSARTKAVLSEDGTHYVLNGTKQFITSSSISDIMTIFAKVDGKHFTGFLVDSKSPGVSFGPEEHKMGIRGTTTTTVILQDVAVPVENVLGEVGQGHKIAFNILNIGRFKLGAVAVGMAKRAIEHTLAYILERKQFGRRIADFGAIREKLGRMAIRTYAAESMVYRTVGLIDQLLASSGDRHGEAALRSIEEYSIECSMAKVHGSEALDYVVDEFVQSLGGYGYCSEYPAEAFYRDSRINRIYEGTNEINRLIVPTMLLRKAGAGVLSLEGVDLTPAESEEGLLGRELAISENLKKIALLVLTRANACYGRELAQKQAVLLRVADLVIGAFVTESSVLRALKASRAANPGAEYLAAAAMVTAEEAMAEAGLLARQCLVSMGDAAKLPELEALCRRESADVVALCEKIAERLIARERYLL